MVLPSKSPCRRSSDSRRLFALTRHESSSLSGSCSGGGDGGGGGHHPHDSEVAAAEQWLTSPATAAYSGAASGGATGKSNNSYYQSSRRSDPGISEAIFLPSFPTGGDAVTRSRSNPSSEESALRGKRLLRERLKQKARAEQRMRQERKTSASSVDSTGVQQQQQQQQQPLEYYTSANSSLPRLSISTDRVDSRHQELMTKEHNSDNSTPSTAASTRSSGSSSLRNTMSGLTLTDSVSPGTANASGHAESSMWTTTSPRTTLMKDDSSENARRARRSAHSMSSVPSSPTSPVSRSSSKSMMNRSNSRTIHSELKISSQYHQHQHPDGHAAPPPPPPPSSRRSSSLASTLNDDWDSSMNDRSARSSSRRSYSQHHSGGPSRRRYRTSSAAPESTSSDEEREKVDRMVATQRAGQAVSSENRQQNTSTNTNTNTAPSSNDVLMGRTNRIKLHVYDLIAQETVMQLPWGCNFPIGSCFNALNSGLHTLGTGAYHVGIEINGIEYAYGANETNGLTGVFTCYPKKSPGYQYRTTIDFGDRALVRPVTSTNHRGKREELTNTQRLVDGREVVREMAAEYMGIDYDLLRKNCVTFAHDACVRLGVAEQEVPEWFRNLCLAGAAAQDAAHSTIEPISKVFSSCDMEGIAELVQGGGGTGIEVINNDGGGPNPPSSGAGASEQIVDTRLSTSTQ